MPKMLFLMSLIAGTGLAQDKSNAECVEKLKIPEYPRPMLFSSSLVGTVMAMVTLGDNGAVNAFKADAEVTRGTELFFTASVEKAVRASSFKSECAGRVVTLIFHFDHSKSAPQDGVSMSFGFPNEFWLTGGPRTAMQ
jgi:hypothetical protein